MNEKNNEVHVRRYRKSNSYCEGIVSTKNNSGKGKVLVEPYQNENAL